MSTVCFDNGDGDHIDSAPLREVKAAGGKLLNKLGTTTIGPGWTKVSCPCCVSEHVEPLVMVKLGENVGPETKRWLIRLIGTPQKDGGAGLLAHPGEDATGDIIVVSAPRCTLLRATEELGLCKTYSNGDMEAFSYSDRDNFRGSDNMETFLTLAERQYIVKYELDGLRAQRDLRIPGLPDTCTLQSRDNICQKLSSAGVIVDTFPLHNPRKLKNLSKAWYCGNQLVQPLDSVNEYFGSSVAFYFSFLDFYTWSLLAPAILGLSITYFSGDVQKEMMESVSGSPGADETEDNSGPAVSGHMLQAVFSMIWSTVVMELWKRRSSSLSYRWGTLHLTERFAEPRPGFHGVLGVNPVTGRVEPLFPDWQRDLRMALVSVPVVGLFLGMVVLGMMCFYWGEAQARQLQTESDSVLSQCLLYTPSILHIIYTNMLATAYKRVAQSLTEYENHREESAFQNHLTAKVLVFTFFNYFAVLFHIAFFKQDVPLLRKGLFAEYIELLVQFGYLSLFSCVFPLTAMLLLLNNLTEIRSDAYKICKLFRKPFSSPVANMGVWQIAFEVLSYVSVVSNCWLLLLSPRLQEMYREGGLSSTNVLLLAVFIEHLLIIVKLIMAVLIPDEPDWIRKKREHIEYSSMQALRQQKLQAEES
ncbi:anoctamin-10 isoform 2-T3 [Pholidichthys leucotaenia]